MPAQRSTRPGFTLIEVLVVLAVISILVTIALPQVQTTIISAREGVLKEDLFHFRDAIDRYYVDKGHYPESLATLVDEGYLRRIESDPITQATDWEEVPAEPDPDNPDDAGGIFDVHSASTQLSPLSGEPYNEW